MKNKLVQLLGAVFFLLISVALLYFRTIPAFHHGIYDESMLELAQVALESVLALLCALTAFFIFKYKGNSIDKYGVVAEGEDNPWLKTREWASPNIIATLGSEIVTACVFATVSLGIFTFYTAFTKKLLVSGNYEPLFYLSPFLMVAAGMLAYSLILFRQWLRFGNITISLDPYPASIGGQMGGTAHLKIPYVDSNLIRVRLMLTHRYAIQTSRVISTGPDINVDILWEASGLVYTEPGESGTKIEFLFDVPGGLKGSDSKSDKNGLYIWIIQLTANLPGADISQAFNIPGFETNKSAENLSKLSVDHPQLSSAGTNDAFSFLKFRRASDGTLTLLYSKLYKFRLKAGLILTAVGIGATLPGVMMVREEVYAVGFPFLITGLLFLTGGLFVLLSNMKVRIKSDSVIATKTLLGIPYSRKSISRHDIKHIKGTGFLWAIKKGGGEMQISPAFETAEASASAAAEIGLRTGIPVE